MASPAKKEPATPLDTARNALIDGTLVDNIATVETLRRALAKLSPEDRKSLMELIPFGPLAEEHSIATDQATPLPASWVEWFAHLGEPSFDAYLDVARKGAEEWPLDNSKGDPLRVKELKDAIEAAQNDPLSVARISEAMPYLVGWLQQDSGFPRNAFVPIYAELLLLTAIDSARSKQIFQSSQVLVSALLDCGLDKAGYNSLLESVDLIAGDGFGVDMAYWLFEIVESLYRCSSPDSSARETFSHGLLARLTPLYGRLSSLQRAALHQLAAELGWSIDVTQEVEEQIQDDGFAEKLYGQFIAIYSLTEDASRQAKKALEDLNPNVKVDISADHVGTQRLKAMSENADLFVISWRSAKHAATNFIRANRGARPLIYARGKGFSSILRALEDHLLQPD